MAEKKPETITMTREDLQQLLEATAKKAAEEAAKKAAEEAAKAAKPQIPDGALNKNLKRVYITAPEKPKVKIRLFKDNQRYKEPLFVAVNGRTYRIARGIEVEVPEDVAEAIRNSEAQDQATEDRIREMEEKFRDESK